VWGDDASEQATSQYELLWKAGQHSNTATATGSYSDDAGHLSTVSDTDLAYYYGSMPGLVTNSSLCTFGDTFNLIFTPDMRLGAPFGYINYKLSDSNPGQFYYNVFYSGQVGEVKEFTFEIPAPFVTQGAVPVHAYSGVDIFSCGGQTCLTPKGEVAGFKLSDMTWGDFDGDGKTEYTFNVTVPETGFLYVNMHLDFGLEKQSGWLKGEAGGLVDYEDAKDNPVVTSSDPAVLPTILEGTEYVFSSNLVGSEDSIFNNNVFKNLKGNGGFVINNQGTLDTADDVLLSKVLLKVVEKAKPGTILWQGESDNDGWFYANFGPTGKKITYTVTADTNGDGKLNGLDKSMDFDLGGPVKFAITDFFGDWQHS
jgi:hypothetical protein